jgi:hypothetical protein
MTLVESVVSGAPAFIADPDMQEILPKDSYILSKDPSSESMAAALSDLLEHPERIAKMSHIAIKNRSPKKISTKISKFESLTH